MLETPLKFKANSTGLEEVNYNSYLEFSSSTKAHKFSQILIKMKIINTINKKAIFLLTESLNNLNLTEYYAKSILRKNKMYEKDFLEKTIKGLYNKNLSKDNAIKKISHICNREELNNFCKLHIIIKDNLLENLNKNEIITLLKVEKRLNIVLDNYRVHKTKLVEKIAEILNINLIFLPPYSPDLNPIEDIWRKIKNIISNNLFKDVNELKKSFLDHYNKIINKTSFYDN